jgi:glycosyltransferase involved in cell wall biosynthesis
MPVPYAQPATFLQRLDNLGHHCLRLGRALRRFLLHLPLLLIWLVRQFFRFVARAAHSLHSGSLLIVALHAAREQFPRRPRFYFIDPSYEDDSGHYRCVARELSRECAARGWSFFHLTGPLDASARSHRLPVFHHAGRLPIRQFDHETEFERVHYLRRATRRALRRLGRQLGFVFALDRWMFDSAESWFFYYTGDFLILRPILDGGRLGPRQHLAVFQFSLPSMFDVPAGRRRFALHAALVARRLAACEFAARIHLCTDSPPLQSWLSPLLGRWLATAHPPLVESSARAQLPAASALGRRPHPFGYFGYVSPKHGWSTVRQLLFNLAGQNTCALLVLNPKRAEPPLIAEARSTALAAGATLHLGFLSDARYAALLDSCSSLLLPYNSSSYSLISSGKLIDAFRHGCFPVVPAHTWLAETVQSLGYGLVVQPGDWSSVPDRLAALDLPALWSRHQPAVSAFIAQFTARQLLTELTDLAAASSEPPG